jgi:hypothetical protein
MEVLSTVFPWDLLSPAQKADEQTIRNLPWTQDGILALDQMIFPVTERIRRGETISVGRVVLAATTPEQRLKQYRGRIAYYTARVSLDYLLATPITAYNVFFAWHHKIFRVPFDEEFQIPAFPFHSAVHPINGIIPGYVSVTSLFPPTWINPGVSWGVNDYMSQLVDMVLRDNLNVPALTDHGTLKRAQINQVVQEAKGVSLSLSQQEYVLNILDQLYGRIPSTGTFFDLLRILS